MITAVDTNVVLDVLTGREHVAASEAALLDARERGGLVACPIVWSELSAWLGSPHGLDAAMAVLGVRFDPIDQDVAYAAGDIQRAYRRAGGPRARLVPDFLVGAHAVLRAERLLTRDRGFFRRYFEGLTVIDPTERE